MNLIDYKKQAIEKWLVDNSYSSQLISSFLIPLQPDLGFYLKVGQLDIFESIFPDEYKQIRTAYFSVITKLTEHHENRNKYIRNININKILNLIK